jgi:uncharacterized protein YdbL (DUF1318 family)
MSKKLLMTGLAAALIGGVALAQGAEDPAIASARASGQVGEQDDGYLGFVKPVAGSVKAAVESVNIKRRSIYTDIAAKQNATVQEVAAARACKQIELRTGPNEYYRVGGVWKQRSGGAVALPSVCG